MQTQYLLTQVEAKDLLSTFAPIFHAEIRGGFNDFQKVQSFMPVYENLTKSTLVWEYIIQRIKKVVADNPDRLRFKKKRRMFLVTIDSKMAIKFKKFNNDFLSSNIPTFQVTNFRGHALKLDNQEIFPVEAGWRVNELYTTIIDVNFVSPNGQNKNLWRIEYRPKDHHYNEIISPEEKDIILEPLVKLNKDNEDAKTAS